MSRQIVRLQPPGALLGVACLTGLSGSAYCGGFALIEHGASGMGVAYAGAAAVSSDTSTAWFNPAGVSELKNREVAVGLHILRTDNEWTDRGTSLASVLGGTEISGPETANPGTVSPVPNFYYAAPINTQWSYALSIGVPFGSSTDYDDDWKGRYTTVDSAVRILDFNPSISYRLSDRVRLGFGISLQYLTAELGSAVDSGAACLSLAGRSDTSFSNADCVNAGLTPGVQSNDGYGEITVDSTAYTFNLGALFLPAEGVKIGIAYRHGSDHNTDGDIDFDVNSALRSVLDTNTNATSLPLTTNILTDTGVSVEVNLPASFSLSGAWQINEKIELLGDVTWTGWSSFEQLRVEYDNPVQGDAVALQEWGDVFRYAAGINYTSNPKLVLRTGLAFDEEAIPGPQRRTARIPGNDRTWFTLGAGYRVSRNASFDVGYAHLFVDETPIDNANLETAGGAIVRGTYSASVDIVSAQFNWEFN